MPETAQGHLLMHQHTDSREIEREMDFYFVKVLLMMLSPDSTNLFDVMFTSGRCIFKSVCSLQYVYEQNLIEKHYFRIIQYT